MKTIVFVTGTRADFGKLKSLIHAVDQSADLECYVFVTGMHLLEKYGLTLNEVTKNRFKNIFSCSNQTSEVRMDTILANTINGFGDYIQQLQPDMIVIHGDRVEALASSIVGALNNILVAHIEGGELSGTVDEIMRHSITKLSHIHLVANDEAKRRVMQMGENRESVFIIGSPDIDTMLSNTLPTIEYVKNYYGVAFDDYSLFCYHSVPAEIKQLPNYMDNVISALVESDINYIVVYPNNDPGSEVILDRIDRLHENRRFKIFPSIRFEFYLSILKHASFIIGNSSAGIREAPIYGVPTINIGSRQNNRTLNSDIINVTHNKNKILTTIKAVSGTQVKKITEFGQGNSVEKFVEIISSPKVWSVSKQKQFVDI
jgi:UDP-N-acetylglucosamine 2-epimerase (hydrolysing)